MGCSILLVDDEESVRTSVSMYLTDKEFEVHAAASVPEALEILDRYLPDVLLVDLQMPGKDGFEMIRQARRRNSATAIIVISGTGDIQKAVQATRMGAMRYLEKPFSLRDLDEAVRLAVEGHGLHAQLARLNEGGLRLEGAGWVLVGASDAMKDIYRKVQMVSRSNQSTVLIQGESGTGKELVARAIFECSERDRNGKFVDVNCAALSETLLEAELFGHEKGAFTGAIESRKGLFGAAHGGSIFLDEIGEMPLKLQAKLLRVLEERSYKRVGGIENLSVDCRVIASTNRDLWEMVEKGEFRRDLFYRLDVFTIWIPPLRERPDDIPALAAHFLKQLARSCNKHFVGFSPAAEDRLTDYAWPGNVRELRNVVERAVILGSGDAIEAEDLIIASTPGRQEPAAEAAPRLETIESMERRLIRRTLVETGWQRARSAEILGINRTTLWQKIKRYGLEGPA
jgi:two-component system response regulator AtoC